MGNSRSKIRQTTKKQSTFVSKVRGQLILILLHWTRTTETSYNFPYHIVEILIVDKYLYHSGLDIKNVLYYSPRSDFTFKFGMIGYSKYHTRNIAQKWSKDASFVSSSYANSGSIKYDIRYKDTDMQQFKIDITLIIEPQYLSYFDGIDGLFLVYNATIPKYQAINAIYSSLDQLKKHNGLLNVHIGLVGDDTGSRSNLLYNKNYYKDHLAYNLQAIDIKDYDIGFITMADAIGADGLMEMVKDVVFTKQKPFYG
eukprot:96847_1